MNTEMEKISSQNNELETSMTEQRALIQKLTDEFSSLKQVVSGHGEVIGDLNELGKLDTKIVKMINIPSNFALKLKLHLIFSLIFLASTDDNLFAMSSKLTINYFQPFKICNCFKFF